MPRAGVELEAWNGVASSIEAEGGLEQHGCADMSDGAGIPAAGRSGRPIQGGVKSHAEAVVKPDGNAPGTAVSPWPVVVCRERAAMLLIASVKFPRVCARLQR